LFRRSSAAQPADWFVEWVRGGRVTNSGVAVDAQNAMTYSAFWACVRIISETIGSLPLITYKRGQGRTKDVADLHPVYRLLHDAPNSEMTAIVFRETLTAHVLTYGNAYAEIVYDNAMRPLALWPIPPHIVTPERDDDGNLRYRIRPAKGAEIILPPGKVLHVPGLGYDGIVGYSPVHYAREAIGLGLATEQAGSAFFGNDSTPGGVLEHPGKLDPQAAKNLRQSWEELHAGKNARRVAVLEQGMKWNSVSIPNSDAQYLETRKFQTTEIARFFRVPPHMIGDLDRATFSNIEHQSIEFVVHCIRPWLIRWEQELNRKLFADKHFFCEHIVDGLLRGDIQARYGAYQTGMMNGWLSPNDIRRLENMNPIKGGDQYFRPQNLAPLDAPVLTLTAPMQEPDNAEDNE
jgi:HK97 family phage portal protein